MDRLKLPKVTLCAASSVNVSATIAALRASLDRVEFAECLFFTDAKVSEVVPCVRVVPIAPLKTSRDYSRFILRELVDHIHTDYVLIVQWDGFVLNAEQWTDEFLAYDYIGAPWPQFSDGLDVGNGGFSLRSRKLLEACRDARFRGAHPEDVAICRSNRECLERQYSIHFASAHSAARFAFERAAPDGPTFGFHGVFNIMPALGSARFWEIYASLDDRSTAFLDYRQLMRQLGAGPQAQRRRLRLTLDCLFDATRRYSSLSVRSDHLRR